MIDTSQVWLTYDDQNLIRRFARHEKQFFYGVRNALNTAVKQLQQAEFTMVRSHVQVRRKEFFEGTKARPGGAAARITQFATFRDRRSGGPKMFAELALYDASKTHTTLLPLFETGGTRRPFTEGAQHVAAPITGRPARPSIAGGVPPQFTFAGLQFRAYKAGKKVHVPNRRRKTPETPFGEFGRLSERRLQLQGVQWKGKERTFILLHAKNAPEGGVFQRYGKEREDVRLIYAFLKPFELERRLDWLGTALRLGPIYLHEAVEEQCIDIIAHNASKALAA